jgi:hypothetical protein
MTRSGQHEIVVPSPPSRGREWRVFLALLLLAVGMIGGFYLIARDAASSRSNSPTALPTPFIASDQACANFAHYWIEESGVTVEPTIIEGLTNCRISESGEWFVPTGARDPRLPAGFAMTETERGETEGVRQQLLNQIGVLEESLSGSMERDLDKIYDPRTRPISGHQRDGESISRARSRYTRVAQAYLMAPEHQLLADYVGWLMAKKIDAYEALQAACESDPSLAYLSTVCSGIEDTLSVRFPPWAWDLRNSVSLEEYLAYLARTNQLPDARTNAA